MDKSKICNERVIEKTVETLYEKGTEVRTELVRDVIQISQIELLATKIKEGFLETVKFPFLFKFKANTKQLNKINKAADDSRNEEKLGIIRKRT